MGSLACDNLTPFIQATSVSYKLAPVPGDSCWGIRNSNPLILQMSNGKQNPDMTFRHDWFRGVRTPRHVRFQNKLRRL